ncbi:MAG TPA: DUF2059 domain-containing protein [Thermoanaerobaculia bacterium]|nr:DUF2059 domain-containing protein [Thermoanaerobaculia bacterium]
MRRLFFAAAALALALPSLAATEPNPTARQRDLVEKLMSVTKMDSMMHSMLDATYAQIEKQYLGGDDGDAEAKEMFALFRAKASKIDFFPDMHEAFVRVYAKYFTEDELQDLINFYGTHTGAKSLSLSSQLMTEGMQIAAQHLTPKIEKLMADVQDEMEHRRPWRKTMRDMRWVSTALEAYAIDHDDLYPSGDYESLKALLTPTYIKEFPEKDMWDHTYAYVVSDDHTHYRIVSAGADTNFEWDSRRIVLPKKGEEPKTVYRDRLEDDLIYADGTLVQAPVQAKSKE